MKAKAITYSAGGRGRAGDEWRYFCSWWLTIWCCCALYPDYVVVYIEGRRADAAHGQPISTSFTMQKSAPLSAYINMANQYWEIFLLMIHISIYAILFASIFIEGCVE